MIMRRSTNGSSTPAMIEFSYSRRTRQEPAGKVECPLRSESALLYELEAGCVVRVRVFLDPEDAFKATGLSE